MSAGETHRRHRGPAQCEQVHAVQQTHWKAPLHCGRHTGVTRDRIYGETDWNGRSFTLIDTGGIEPRTDDQILSFMRDQAQIAIENATVIIFLTDVRTGLTASDQEVANMLLRSGKPIVPRA